MLLQPLFWPFCLAKPPSAALMVFATHGPNISERHCIHGFWSIHLYQYAAELQIGRTILPVRPGFVGLIPPETQHTYHLREKSTHLCGHFALPPSPDAEGTRIPAMQDLGDDFARMHEAFEEGAAWLTSNHARANIRLWDILWQLTDRQPPSLPEQSRFPGCVRRACEIIEQSLEQPWNVPALAQAVEVSHNHLTRQFQAMHGTTVVGYIRRRRMERAEHLLLHTDLPIKAIAAQVGVEDPRLFNKMVHQERGMSPQKLREHR